MRVLRSAFAITICLWLVGGGVAVAQPAGDPGAGGNSAPAVGSADSPAADVQSAAAETAEPEQESWQVRLRQFLEEDMLPIGKKILFALLLFLGGWFFAKLFSWMVYRVLLRTTVDDALAEKLGLKMLLDESKDENRVERAVARSIYYLLMLLVAVAVLQFAGLTEAAKPIQSFVDRITAALPLVGKAALILIVAYFGGLILQALVTGGLDRVQLDAKFAELSSPAAERDEADAEEGEEPAERPFSQNAGRVVFWLLMVAGIAGAADALDIGPLEHSLQNGIDRIVQLLPSIAIAALLVIAGIVFGRISRTVVDNVLDSAGFNKLVAKIKLDKLFGETRTSDVIGIVVMAFIVVQASIAALNEVNLQTLSGPLTEMMSRFWQFLPVVAVSVLIVIAGVIAGRVLREVIENALDNMGFDDFIAKLGFGNLERGDTITRPHELVGLVAQVGVILVATVQALDNMLLHQWAAYVNAFIRYSVTHAAVALVIVAVGITLGNYVRDLIYSRRRGDDDDTLRWIASFARYAVLVFAFTMAIHHLNVGPNFVLISFSLLFGSLCLALALALGLGSRNVAGEIVREQYERARAEIKSRQAEETKAEVKSRKKTESRSRKSEPETT